MAVTWTVKTSVEIFGENTPFYNDSEGFQYMNLE